MKGFSGVLFFVLIFVAIILGAYFLSSADYGVNQGEITGGWVERTKCSDPDSKDIYTTGTCTDSRGIYVDNCYSNTVVNEYYCSSTFFGGKCSIQRLTCPSGYACASGRCNNQCVVGTATAKYPVTYSAYGSNQVVYKFYSDIGSNNAWARIVVKTDTATVESYILNEGSARDSKITTTTVRLTDIRALQDGTVLGADLVIGPLGFPCQPTTTTTTTTTPTSSSTTASNATITPTTTTTKEIIRET